MPSAAGEGLVHYHPVHFIILNIFNKTFNIRVRPGALPGFVIPESPIFKPSPG